MAAPKPMIFSMGGQYLDCFVYRTSYAIYQVLQMREECIAHLRECSGLHGLSAPEIGAVLDCMVLAGLAEETGMHSGYYQLTERARDGKWWG